MEEMGSTQQPASSGLGGDPRYAGLDERTRKRMISNRESARRSRMRKQRRLDGLLSEATQLEKENNLIEEKIISASNMYLGLANQNNVMRAQLAEMTDWLHSLNSVLQIAEEVSGIAVDIPEIPDALLEPWQLPCPITHPVHSPASMFQC